MSRRSRESSGVLPERSTPAERIATTSGKHPGCRKAIRFHGSRRIGSTVVIPYRFEWNRRRFTLADGGDAPVRGGGPPAIDRSSRHSSGSPD
ncbi:hypothetical protein EA472_09795 [Natrarchaeobius oligotrophus]|uniref:Uncharacterized protein n=1 Tax=Natrarchaeobius chitinivorans TaxID=1679083 RepID=A0A3N6PP40_NATCH|nr:hypothetical protein EA472_09795 [Natrarchaeobius chitinivorans]